MLHVFPISRKCNNQQDKLHLIQLNLKPIVHKKSNYIYSGNEFMHNLWTTQSIKSKKLVQIVSESSTQIKIFHQKKNDHSLNLIHRI